MRKLIVCGVGLVAALALTVPGAFGGAAQTPGVTAKTITIGGTFPLTGPAAAYAPIPVGMKAYFSYINARRGPDGKRGVMGRQIVWKFYDDGYNPANTVQLTRRLVEQDKVFATVGQLGTEHILAARSYLNQAEGAAGARLDRRLVLGHAVQGVPVDDRLAARLHRRGSSLRPPHQGEPQRQEDRRRSTRTTTTARTTSRLPFSARQAVLRREHRRSGGIRGDGDERRLADDADPGKRSDDLRAPPDSRPPRSARMRRARRSASTPTRSISTPCRRPPRS